jgi:hypothetical protein
VVESSVTLLLNPLTVVERPVTVLDRAGTVEDSPLTVVDSPATLVDRLCTVETREDVPESDSAAVTRAERELTALTTLEPLRDSTAVRRASC